MRTFIKGVLAALVIILLGMVYQANAQEPRARVTDITASVSVIGQAPATPAQQARPVVPNVRQSPVTVPTPRWQDFVLPSPEVGAYQGPVAAGTVFRWRVVGGDPCNPDAGCTLRYALERSGWPVEVQQALLNKVQSEAGREVTITRNWQGWMTWGSQTPKFHPRTIADFNQVEPAFEWSHVFQGTEFVLIRVSRCRNWGGSTRTPTPPQPTRPGFPLVACP